MDKYMEPDTYSDLFADWVKTTRREKSLSLSELAVRAESSHTSIGRLENKVNGAVLGTFVKVTDALEEKRENFFEYMNRPKPKVSLDKINGPYPTEKDIENFQSYGEKKRLEAGEFIASWLNRIYKAYWDPKHLRRYGTIYIEKPDTNDPYLVEPFLPTDIYKIGLQNSPLLLKPVYPDAINEDVIRKIFLNNGALISMDVSTYLDDVYDKFDSSIKTTNQKKTSLYRMASQIKDKIVKANSFANIKLGEVFFLDEYLGCSGELFLMSSNVVSLEQKTLNFSQMRLGELLIYISRWIENYELSNQSWMQQLREDFQS